ncbi:Transcriptional regulator [Ruminococcaceae bacterium BL-6]|nr:Transcriptional regulator [Ruminococcaceae bacterium BL-6]
MMDALYSGDTVNVTMLGKFTIQKGKHTLSQSSGRTKQVWLLIEYLVAHRHLETSVEKLIEVLWDDDDSCSDPLNALKNLVYRARALLKKSLHDTKTPFIVYSHGSYLWNPDLPCVVDVEEMERLAKEASASGITKEQKISLLKQAVSYYHGDFLPNSSYANWVVSRTAYLSSLYISCVLKLCALYEENQDYEEIITVCEAAIVCVPFEESIHKILTYAYISTGQNSKALKHYNYVTDLFYRELGVDISGSLRELYKQITNSINQVEMDLSIIKQDLKEACAGNSAYFCDYEIFKNLYRIQARSLIRTGQSIFIALLSLLDSNGSILKDSSAVPAVNLFKEDILLSLRKGDTVAAYSSTQFIVMLPLINYENAERVMHRIIRRFEKDYKKNDTKIIYKLGPVDSIES